MAVVGIEEWKILAAEIAAKVAPNVASNGRKRSWRTATTVTAKLFFPYATAQ